MTRTKRPPFIAVIGGSTLNGGDEGRRATEVGRLLAERGAVLVCGAGEGVMEAACRGAKSAGGVTIGIVGGADQEEANGFVDYPIVTGVGESRNSIVARTADALIAVGGEYGTLSEIAFALKFGKRVVGLDTWHLVRSDGETEHVMLAETPEEAVRRALEGL
jgi:uncharacterized protein (TIGR00725 family)